VAKRAPKRRFDFVKLEAAALESWLAWDRDDTPASRTAMFTKIMDLTFAVIFSGDFEKKFNTKLGSDPDAGADERIREAAYEYTVYLFERIVTRSKTFYPKEGLQEVVMEPGTVATAQTVEQALRKTEVEQKGDKPGKRPWLKQPFEVRGFKKVPAKAGDKGERYEVDYKFHKFALQPYINQNLRHVLLTKKKEVYNTYELLDALEASLQDGREVLESTYQQPETTSERFSRRGLAKRIYKSLRMFYPPEEISRLFGITCEMIYHNERGLGDGLPEDIRDFAVVLTGITKRVARENNVLSYDRLLKRDFNTALQSAVRSSVFLSSVVNSEFFDKRILLAMDVESLYRLATLMGGQTLQVPTLRELDTLIGAVSAISEAVVNGKAPEKAIRDAKADLGLVFSHTVNLKKFVANAIESHSLYADGGESTPLVNVLLASIACLEKTFDGLVEKSRGATPGELAKLYATMVESCTNFTNSLVNVSAGGKRILKEAE
jgi:hypothetical protein